MKKNNVLYFQNVDASFIYSNSDKVRNDHINIDSDYDSTLNIINTDANLNSTVLSNSDDILLPTDINEIEHFYVITSPSKSRKSSFLTDISTGKDYFNILL